MPLELNGQIVAVLREGDVVVHRPRAVRQPRGDDDPAFGERTAGRRFDVRLFDLDLQQAGLVGFELADGGASLAPDLDEAAGAVAVLILGADAESSGSGGLHGRRRRRRDICRLGPTRLEARDVLQLCDFGGALLAFRPRHLRGAVEGCARAAEERDGSHQGDDRGRRRNRPRRPGEGTAGGKDRRFRQSGRPE